MPALPARSLPRPPLPHLYLLILLPLLLMLGCATKAPGPGAVSDGQPEIVNEVDPQGHEVTVLNDVVLAHEGTTFAVLTLRYERKTDACAIHLALDDSAWGDVQRLVVFIDSEPAAPFEPLARADEAQTVRFPCAAAHRVALARSAELEVEGDKRTMRAALSEEQIPWFTRFFSALPADSNARRGH